MSEQLPDIGKIGWQELVDTVKQVMLEKEIEIEMEVGRFRITDEWDFVTMKSSVLDRFYSKKSEWEQKNKRKIISSDFLEILLENHMQDYTGKVQPQSPP